MHSQEGWAHFAADAIGQSFRARPAVVARNLVRSALDLPADPRRGNLRLYGSGYKPSRNMV